MAEERREALERSLTEYYESCPDREKRLQRILNHEAGFSLREIDWFVTNMAARKPQIFKDPKSGRVVDVNGDYKDVLRCYHKASFDSFCRRGRVDEEDASFKQRIFFRWAFENGIVEQVESKISEIKHDMQTSKKRSQDVADPAKKRKRKDPPPSGFAIIQSPKELKIPNFTNMEW